MEIGEIIGEYVYLKAMGRDFVGRCPFCLYHDQTMVVIPQLQTYECLHCRQSGGAVDFIRRMERITYWDYRRSIKQPVPKHTIGTVYVLSLEGSRFYVGFTQDLPHRLSQHFKHKGALWTKRFRALQLVDVYYDVPEFVEHRVTRRYIEQYGPDRVRGGWHLDARDAPGEYRRYPSKPLRYR